MTDSEESETGIESDDFSDGEVAASKRHSRINALILALVFLVLTVAPSPWNVYAPLLFLIPFIRSLVNRIRNASASSKRDDTPDLPQGMEHYTYTPKDPKDPRRYKPIG